MNSGWSGIIYSPTAEQNTQTNHNFSEEIPQLEEDWENGQFDDADNNLLDHNTQEENRQEYSQ